MPSTVEPPEPSGSEASWQQLHPPRGAVDEPVTRTTPGRLDAQRHEDKTGRNADDQTQHLPRCGRLAFLNVQRVCEVMRAACERHCNPREAEDAEAAARVQLAHLFQREDAQSRVCEPDQQIGYSGHKIHDDPLGTFNW